MGLQPFILLQNKTMKKLFVIALLFCVQFGYAQIFGGDKIINNENFDKQRWSWGYYLGFNTYDFKFKYNDEITSNGNDLIIEKTMGFNVGLVGNLKLNNNLDLRLEPGVTFNTRNFRPPYSQDIEEVNSTSINLSSNENNPDVATRLKTNNYHYEVGLGIDLYLYYFKFSPSIRGVFTINNEMVETQYQVVDAMRSQAVFLNFTFQ